MKEYTKKQIDEIQELSKYLNENFKEENKGRSFSNQEVKDVYEAMGQKFNPSYEYDVLIGRTLGWDKDINFRLKSFRKVSPGELEEIVEKSDNKKVKLNSYGEIISGTIFFFVIVAAIFSVGKLTGYNIATVYDKVNFFIWPIVFVFGIFLLGIYFYLKGGRKNGRK